jgi:hypothetical protein
MNDLVAASGQFFGYRGFTAARKAFDQVVPFAQFLPLT